MLFCPEHTAIVEFIAAGRKNVFVFGAYAHVYGFPYWMVISLAKDYSKILPADVVETAQQALRRAGSSMPEHVVPFNSDYLRDGYDRYTAAGHSAGSPAVVSSLTRAGW